MHDICNCDLLLCVHFRLYFMICFCFCFSFCLFSARMQNIFVASNWIAGVLTCFNQSLILNEEMDKSHYYYSIEWQIFYSIYHLYWFTVLHVCVCALDRFVTIRVFFPFELFGVQSTQKHHRVTHFDMLFFSSSSSSHFKCFFFSFARFYWLINANSVVERWLIQMY